CRTLLSADRGNLLCSWDVEKGKLNWSSRTDRPISCLSVAPDGRHFASGGSTGVTIHEMDNKIRWLLTEFGAASLAYAPDGKTLAVGLLHGSISVFEIASSRPLTGRFRREWLPERQRLGISDGVQALSFSPDGRVVASGSQTGVVTLWDVTGR